MRIPRFLERGDRIGLVCTARKMTSEELAPTIELLELWGFEPVIGDSIGAESHQFAGEDHLRARDMQTMLDDDSIDAVLCCRGGYGTVRIMDHLDYTRFMDRPKWIIGYSDVTVLHSQLNSILGMASMHASMPSSFPTNSETAIQSIKHALEGQPISYEWGPNSMNRTGQAKGIVVGGNLSLIYSLLGTKTGIHTSGNILFLEDLDEYLYHIDRMMMSLKRAGKLDGLAALIVGGMTDMNDNDIPFGKTAKEIIAEHVAEYDYPVAFDFPAGHIHDNRPLLLGVQSTLSVRMTGCAFDQPN